MATRLDENEAECSVWRGIGYARPPVGSRRLRLPAPVQVHAPTADHRAPFGAACPQIAPRGTVLPDPGVVQSEDCLTLNVWSGSEPGTRRPVMVWVHGGAFVSGTGAHFDATHLAADGQVVVVTLNYRLGPLGFLPPAVSFDGTLTHPPNLGLLDLAMALRWVRSHIERYGGDPEQVTVAGQGSGASCVLALLAMPVAADLFRRAAAFSPTPVTTTFDEARVAGARLADDLGVDVRRLAEATGELSTDEVVRYGAATLAGPLPDGRLPFTPWVDGRVVTATPTAALADGRCLDKPLLLSTCEDEMALEALVDPERLDRLAERLRARTGGAGWESLLRRYRAIAPDGERWRSRLIGAGLVDAPVTEMAVAQAEAGGDAWLLRFAAASSTPPYDRIGNCGGADLPFLWNAPRVGTDAYHPGLQSAAEVEVATALQSALVSFVTTGRPSVGEIPWAPVTPSAPAAMRLGPSERVMEDRVGLLETWAGLSVW